MMSIEVDKILEHYLRLNEFGFTRLEFEDGVNATNYIRLNDVRIDTLKCLIFDIDKKEKGLFLTFRPAFNVIFPVVNEILELADVGIVDRTWKWEYNDERSPQKFTCRSHPDFNPNFNLYPELSENMYNGGGRFDERVLKRECERFKEMFKNEILPFYNLIPNLQTINDDIIEKYHTMGELVKFISTLTPYKKMIIMSECDNPNYYAYLTEFEAELKKGLEINEKMYRPFYKFFLNLKKVLSLRRDG